jgi:hypothetical protein
LKCEKCGCNNAEAGHHARKGEPATAKDVTFCWDWWADFDQLSSIKITRIGLTSMNMA